LRISGYLAIYLHNLSGPTDEEQSPTPLKKRASPQEYASLGKISKKIRKPFCDMSREPFLWKGHNESKRWNQRAESLMISVTI